MINSNDLREYKETLVEELHNTEIAREQSGFEDEKKIQEFAEKIRNETSAKFERSSDLLKAKIEVCDELISRFEPGQAIEELN